MGLWYTTSEELCRCCGWTCCCRCRPKQTTPAFVVAFVLLGSAIVLALMLAGSLPVGYYSVPLLGFVASISLLCYMVGIQKQSVPDVVRRRRYSWREQMRQQLRGSEGLDQWYNEVLRTLERQRAAAEASGVSSQRNAATTVSASPTTVSRSTSPSSEDRAATPSENTAQHRATRGLWSVVSNGFVRAFRAVRASARTTTHAPEYGHVVNGGGRDRQIVYYIHDPNAEAPNYFDVVPGYPPGRTADRSDSKAAHTHRPGTTRTSTIHHAVLEQRVPTSTQETSLESLPNYDSIFPRGAVFNEEEV